MTKPLADVYHLDCYGEREAKYQLLLDNGVYTLPWRKLDCRAPEYFFVAKDFGVLGEYEKGFSVNELFTIISTGIQTHRDEFVVDINKATLATRIQTFHDLSLSAKEIIDKFQLKESCDWKISEARQNEKFNKAKIADILYRPFDYRKIYYSSNLIDRGREKVMGHLLKAENIGLCFNRQIEQKRPFTDIFIVSKLFDKHTLSLKESNSIAPLYLFSETGGQQSINDNINRQPNLNPAILEQIAARLGLPFAPEKTAVMPAGMRASSDKDVNVSNPWTLDSGNPCRNDEVNEQKPLMGTKKPLKEYDNPASFAPIDLLDYIYAVLHSPNYRDTYKEFLKTDFPRVPYPDPATFWQLAKLGGELRQLHLLEHPTLTRLITTYPVAGDNAVSRKINNNDFTINNLGVHGPTSSPRTDSLKRMEERFNAEITGRVWINDTQYFDGVPKIAWDFYIGGYQPAQKWLKDRHGRTLTFEDILHYQKIIVALHETRRIMLEIDAV